MCRCPTTGARAHSTTGRARRPATRTRRAQPPSCSRRASTSTTRITTVRQPHTSPQSMGTRRCSPGSTPRAPICTSPLSMGGRCCTRPCSRVTRRASTCCSTWSAAPTSTRATRAREPRYTSPPTAATRRYCSRSSTTARILRSMTRALSSPRTSRAARTGVDRSTCSRACPCAGHPRNPIHRRSALGVGRTRRCHRLPSTAPGHRCTCPAALAPAPHLSVQHDYSLRIT
mmetsp:Transcript_17073/g.43749  ORF Transcript_17073/g.43749 Transcript_17073/m.43749 type:complete len:230 (+) Transcript_17073:732-1421(+)